MEFLEIEKQPISKEKVLKISNIEVVKIDPLGNENSENLKEFLDFIWNKRMMKPKIEEEKIYTIENAIRTNIQIKLIQYSEEELKHIYDKQVMGKFNVEINTDVNEENIDVQIERIKKTQKTKKIRKNIENGIVSELLLEQEEILDKYKYYIDDNSIKFDLSKHYILNNKKSFLNDIKRKMMGLDVLLEDDVEEKTIDGIKKYKPFIHQLIVKQYLNSFSPYRGLLLYHGLGSGKTCTSIGIIESMKYNKDHIFILTPASLKQNYMTQMKFCGNQLFKQDNYWVFVEFPTDNTKKSFINRVHELTHLPLNYLKTKAGVFLVDKTRANESNYYDLSKKDAEIVDEQIELMIHHKFVYISYNGITDKIWKDKYSKNDTLNPFHNSTIIIDEGHNFVSRIVNKINAQKTSVSTKMYENIMSAENCNVVVLSGTPLINYPCELGVLFNLIGGYNITYEFRINHVNGKFLSQKRLSELLRQDNKSIDLIEYNSNESLLRITQNPFGFVTENDNTIKYDDNIGKLTSNQFIEKVIKILKNNKYKLSDPKVKKYKKFPDNDQEFNKYFVGKQNNFIKKPYFQSKIVGMASYLGDKRSLMPDMVVPDENEVSKEDIFIENIVMNDFVLQKYSEERKKELEMDKRGKKMSQLQNKESFSSSYRIFSRSACNFTFPDDIVRPMPHGNYTKMTEDELENLSDKEKLTHNDGLYDDADISTRIRETKNGDFVALKNEKKSRTFMENRQASEENIEATNKEFKSAVTRHLTYAQKIEDTLQLFEENSPKYFESSIPKYVTSMPENKSSLLSEETKNNLMKLSPKIHKILENLMNEENIGLHLLYSNFRQLGGIGILIKVLDYYGYTRLKIRKDPLNPLEWELDISHPYYTMEHFKPGRKFYALYTGKESAEEKEIIRNIFNSDLNKIKSSRLKEQISAIFGEDRTRDTRQINHYGKLIKLLIISASGAEGIDLKNVRFVHIMEPYWHPVRINQVIGRARRINSHVDLPKELQNVKVFMYLLTYDKSKEMLEKIENSFAHLRLNDKDERDNLVSTDERLYQIMLRKKKLMEEFLTGIKEASIDCLVNYEDKTKCLHFPSSKSGNKKYISKVNYKDNKYDTFQEVQQKQAETSKEDLNEENEANEDEKQNKRKKLVRMELLSKEDKTKHKLYAVNISNNPYIAYEYDAYVNYGQLFKVGFVRRNDEDELYVE